MEASDASEESPPIGWFVPVAVTLAAWAVFSYASPHTPVTTDATRDQLLVRDCLELGACHTAGAPTSVSGVRQGAGWIDLLALLRLVGLDVAGERRAVLLLNGLAVGTMFLLAGRLKRSLAWPAALLATWAIVTIGTARLLINTSLDVLPEIVGTGSLLLFAAERRRGLLLGAAFAIGTAVNFHVGASSLVPALLIVAAQASWTALLLSAVTLTGATLLTAWDAWEMNLDQLQQRHLLPVALGGLVLCIVAGRVLRRLPKFGVAHVVAIIAAPFLLGFLWLVAAEHHGVVASYFHPVLGPACLTLAFGLDSVLRRVPTIGERTPRVLTVTLAALIFVASGRSRAEIAMRPEWTYDDARVIARQLMDHGVTYSDATTRLQAPRCHDLIPAVGVYLDARKPFTPSPMSFSVPPGAPGALESRTSTLRFSPMVACRLPVGSGAPTCAPATPPNAGEQEPPGRFLFSTRGDLATHALSTPPPFIARYQLDVALTSDPVTLSVVDDSPPGCGWKITGLEGLHTNATFPTTRLSLAGPEGDSGHLYLERPFGTPGCGAPAVDSLFLPCLVEGD
jgi:hypothetical protein